METPWYYRKKPPVFCDCWRPIYEIIFPQRKLTVLIASAVICLGLFFWLAAFIACVVGRCYGGYASLWFLGFTLLWFGLMFFHCGWAAHLLDGEPEPRSKFRDPDAYEPTTANGGEFVVDMTDHSNENEPLKTGYWQFSEKPAWQAVSSFEPTGAYYSGRPHTAIIHSVPRQNLRPFHPAGASGVS